MQDRDLLVLIANDAAGELLDGFPVFRSMKLTQCLGRGPQPLALLVAKVDRVAQDRQAAALFFRSRYLLLR